MIRMAFVAAFTLAVCARAAAADAPAARPEFKVGDRWEFRQRAASGAATELTREVVEVRGDGIVRMKQENGNVLDYDNALNFVTRDRGPEHARALVRYPIEVGKSWDFTRGLENPTLSERGSAKVAARETITVPAGRFECYRIEAEATISNRGVSQHRLWKRWYCPEVKWIAKEVLEERSNTTQSVLTSELVRFTPGP